MAWTARLVDDPRVDLTQGTIVLQVDYFDAADTTFTNVLFSKAFNMTPPLILSDVVATVRSEGQRVRAIQSSLAALSPQIHAGATVNIP